MRPKKGELREAYDLIETYLTRNPPEDNLQENRLTAPLGTSVFVSLVVIIRDDESSYFVRASTSVKEGWLTAEKLLYEFLGEDITDTDEEILNPIIHISHYEDRVVALTEMLNDEHGYNYRLLVDVYCTEVRSLLVI